MMVSEGVLRRDVAPPHRHPEPMGGPGGPPPTRPGPAQHRLPGGPRPGRGPHPAAGQSTGAARTGLRARGPSAPEPALDRGPGLSSGRPAPVCRPQPGRGPRSAASHAALRPPERAGLPTPAPPRQQPLRRPRLGLRLRLRPPGRVNAARAPRAPAPASAPLPPAARPQRRPLPPHTPRARPSHWLNWAEGSPPPALAQPGAPETRAPQEGKGPLNAGNPEDRCEGRP